MAVEKSPKDGATRQKELRARRKKEGLVLLREWVTEYEKDVLLSRLESMKQIRGRPGVK